MNLRQLINLIEAEPSVQGTAAGYAPARPAPTAADDTDTGGAAKPAPGIAAGSPAITGKAPADNMKNAGDVMRTAQGGSDTLGASNMASAPSAAPAPAPAADQFSQNIAMANRNSAAAAKPATATTSAPPTAPPNQAAMSYAGNNVAQPAGGNAKPAEPVAGQRPGGIAFNQDAGTTSGQRPGGIAFNQDAGTRAPAPDSPDTRGGAAKPASASTTPAPAANTYSTEKGLFGSDINVRTDAQGRKFVPNPQKQGAMSYLNRAAPDEVRYYSADDVKQGVSGLADRFKSFFSGGKAPAARPGTATAGVAFNQGAAPQEVTKEDTDMSELRRLSGLPLNEKAASKQQQKFMGMVHAMQKGEKVKGASKELKKAAKGMSKKDAKDFASTKHKDLPNKVTESVMLEAGSALEHIINKFKHETKNFLSGSELDKDLYEALFDYYDANGEMPYSVAKAKDGQDPYQWISQHLENELDTMGYQRQTESSHALSELARLAGLSEAGPGRKAPAPNYAAIARRRMANMPPSTGTQDLGDVGPGEITPLDLSRADKSSTEQFPPSSKFSDMTPDEVIAQTNPGQQPLEPKWAGGKKGGTKLATRPTPAATQTTAATTEPLGGSAKPTPATPVQPKSNWMSQDLARQRADAESELDLMKIKEADELNQMRRIAGLKECDMGMDQQDSMNVSTNMSSDGTKSVSISAQGDKADALLQMLKMAGMRAHDNDNSMGMTEPEVIMVSSKPRDEMMEDAGGIQVHDLSDMDDGSAYDETQVSDEIHDGDVIITRNGVGVMVEAWPVIVVGNSSSFHKLNDGTSWDEFEGGKYADSAQKAMEVSGDNEMVDEAERVTQYTNTPDEEYQTVDSIIRQGNDLNREKQQYSMDRGRDNPMAFELEESLADMLESIKVQEGGNAGGIDAEQPYKDPKTGKMITPPKGATMPPPDSQYPPGDKRNMMPAPTRKK
jgi:hypothetical protein